MAGTYLKIENNAETTLNGDLTDVAESIVVTSVASLPSTFPYLLTIWDEGIYPDPTDDPTAELVLVTSAADTTLTATRGYGDTDGAAHSNGARIALLINKEIITDSTYGIEAVLDNHMDADTGTHGVGSDYLAKTSKSSQIGEFTATAVVGKSGAVDYLTSDYATDDACIQAAIDTVNTAGGGSVYIKEGTYAIKNNLAMKSNVSLIGSSQTHKSILQGTAGGSLSAIIGITGGSSNIHIGHLCIDADNIASVKGVSMGNTQSDIYIKDNIFKNIVERVVVVTDFDNLQFDNNYVVDCGVSNAHILSLDATLGGRLSIRDNIFETIDIVTAYCIAYHGTTQATISGNNFKDVKSVCIHSKGNSNSNISANSFYNTGYGTSFEWLAAIDVKNNTYELVNLVIDGNTFKQTQDTAEYYGGILVSGEMSATNKVHNVTISNNVLDGGLYSNIRPLIYSHGHSSNHNTDITISGNTVYNGDDGIQLANTDRYTITGNTCSNNGASGITISYSDRGVISGNICVNNGQGGTYGTTASGIYLVNTDWCSVIGNVCSDTQGTKTQDYGIREYLGGNRNVIRANDVRDNNTAGVLHLGNLTYVTDNQGFNPVGNFTAPAMPASTVAKSNEYGYPCMVVVYGGTVSDIRINNITTGLTSGPVIIPPGNYINIIYSEAPSWTWWGQ